MLQFKPIKLVKQIYKKATPLEPSSLPHSKDMHKLFSGISKVARAPTHEKTFSDIRSWLLSITPTLKSKLQTAKCQNQDLANILLSCFRLRVYRKDLIQIMDRKITKQNRIPTFSFSDLVTLYSALVSLRSHDQEFVSKLREQILGRLEQIDKIENMRIFLFLSQFLFLENSSPQHLNLLAKRLNPIFLKNLNEMTTLDPKAYFRYIAILYEIATLYKIPIEQQILNYWKQVHSSAQRVQNDADLPLIQEQKSKFSSIFEKIFQNNLKEYGYSFETNLIIKQNEYDVLVTGRNKRRFFPLQNIDIFNPEVPEQNQLLQQVSKRSKLRQLQWLSIDEKFPQAVILDLNGPQHYLQSDIHPPQSVTKKQLFKFEKLALYGFQAYNLVNSEQWEQISKFPKLAEKFIENKITNPIRLNKYE